VKLILQHKPFDIFVINETKLDSSVSDSAMHVDGFNFVRNDRNRHGGGVAIYINDAINFCTREDFCPQGLELLCTEI